MATRNAQYLDSGIITRMSDAGDTHPNFKRRLAKAANLTIASGAITITGPGVYSVDTEGAAATDDLATINGGIEGDVIVILARNDARTVNIVETGNIAMPLNSFGLDNIIDSAVFVKIGTTWHRMRGINL